MNLAASNSPNPNPVPADPAGDQNVMDVVKMVLLAVALFGVTIMMDYGFVQIDWLEEHNWVFCFIVIFQVPNNRRIEQLRNMHCLQDLIKDVVLENLRPMILGSESLKIAIAHQVGNTVAIKFDSKEGGVCRSL